MGGINAVNGGGYYPGGAGYYPKKGGFDPNSIWFQYLLCQEQKISCYLFTQGWNQKDYGQYYLYQNVLGDTSSTVLDTSTAKPPANNDFLTLALLAGAGKQQYYPHQGYPAEVYPAEGYPAYPPYRKRRDIGYGEEDIEAFECEGD